MSESDIEITSVEEPIRTQADSPDLEIIAETENEELSIDEELLRIGRRVEAELEQDNNDFEAEQQQNTADVNAESVNTQQAQNSEINTDNVEKTSEPEKQGQQATATPRLETIDQITENQNVQVRANTETVDLSEMSEADRIKASIRLIQENEIRIKLLEEKTREALEQDIANQNEQTENADSNVRNKRLSGPKMESRTGGSEFKGLTDDTDTESKFSDTSEDESDEDETTLSRAARNAEKLATKRKDQKNEKARKKLAADIDRNKAKKLSAEEVEEIEENFPDYTYRANLPALTNHKRFEYMLQLLTGNEVTLLTEGEGVRMNTFYISPQSMVDLITRGRYQKIKTVDPETQNSNIILSPFDGDEIAEADSRVKDLPINQRLSGLTERYPFYPLMHMLPVVQMDSEPWDFENWDPPLPTAEDCRVFKYAPTNIRFEGKTYAANCRHEVSAGDEHPWCPRCLRKANIQKCVTSDDCYLCNRMTKEAKKRLHSSNTYSTKPVAEPKRKVRLAAMIKTQIHADFADRTSETTKPEDYIGYCRPANVVPLYMTAQEFVSKMEDQLDSEIENQKTAFILSVEKVRAKLGKQNKPVDKWPDFDELRKEYKKFKTLHSPAIQIKRKADTESPELPPGDTPQRKRLKLKSKSQSEKPEVVKTPRVKKRAGKQKGLYPKSSAKWSLQGSKIRLDQSDSRYHYRYESALDAARKYVKTEVEQKTPETKGDSFAEIAASENRVLQYKPYDGFIQKISQTLQYYSKDYWNPELPITIQLDLADFPESGMKKNPQSAVPDSEGCFPHETSTVDILQKEIIRLDASNRALLKLLQADQIYLRAIHTISKKKPEDKNQAKTLLTDLNSIVVALIRNHDRRENRLAENTGITLAVRRRDNSFRKYTVADEARDAVSAAVIPENRESESTDII